MHARVGLLVAALAFGLRDLIAALAGWAAVPYRVATSWVELALVASRSPRSARRTSRSAARP